jgi:PadR family transcriptional regulator, regulatory protein PadR
MITKTLMAASTRPVILAGLSAREDYGYNIIQKVKKISGGSLEWTDGMLYSVLQRMEIDGLVTSRWKIDGESRPRRYFQITDEGRRVLASEMANWKQILKAMIALCQQPSPES